MEISKWRNEWINTWVNKNNAKIWLWKKDLCGLKNQGMVFILVFTENLQYWIVDTIAQKCCNSLDTSKGMHRDTDYTLTLRKSSLTQQAYHIYLFRFSHIDIILYCFVKDFCCSSLSECKNEQPISGLKTYWGFDTPIHSHFSECQFTENSILRQRVDTLVALIFTKWKWSSF